MRILQLHISLEVMGGIESFICYLSNEMALIGNNVVTFCSIFPPQNNNSPFYTRLSKEVTKDYLHNTTEKFSLKTAWKIYKYIKNSNVDIVHIHGFFYYYLIAIVLLHSKVRFVYTFHSDAYKENTIWDEKILWLKKYCIKKQWIHAVTISSQSQESFSRLYNSESRLIENGIKSPLINIEDNRLLKFKIDNNTKLFLHPGRICKEKNQLVLCRVFNRLIKEGYDVCLLIVGTIQGEEIFNQIKEEFNERIRFIGERNDIPQLFFHADGFCLPSIWEGLPLTLLEAISVGCPPICSPVGGVVSVVEDGVNGILSKSSSENDYYEAMKRFLKMSSSDIKTMKQLALKTFSSYNITTTAQKYLDYYSELLHI